MTTITTNIANGVDKVVNDVTTAAEAALPVLAEASFQYALQLAFNALLFMLLIHHPIMTSFCTVVAFTTHLCAQ